jgi:hypothetical protein
MSVKLEIGNWKFGFQIGHNRKGCFASDIEHFGIKRFQGRGVKNAKPV